MAHRNWKSGTISCPSSGKKDLPPKPRMPAGFLHSSTTWRIPLYPSFTRKISHRSALRSAMECKGKRKRSGAGQRFSFIAFADHETKKPRISRFKQISLYESAQIRGRTSLFRTSGGPGNVLRGRRHPGNTYSEIALQVTCLRWLPWSRLPARMG
jgi:hypothetical protein